MAEKSSPVKFWMGHKLYIYTKDPAHAELILTNLDTFDRNHIYEIMAKGMGYGLVTMPNCKYSYV